MSNKNIENSYGINRSKGVNGSNGINGSDGVNWSYGVINSFGVDNALFLADKPRTHSLFGKEVSEDRFDEVWETLFNKLDGWFPKFNDAFIYLKQEKGEWGKVDASEITDTLENWEEPYEAWKDMPVEAIEYLRSLPEFDVDIFKRVTGIDVEVQTDDKTEEAIALLKERGYKIVKK